ncbi:MAG: hypothetical protein JXB47_00230 [Anaerolineae bacterium]|nr:hypothetical protein [Anaerolineae bacterium]
MSKYAALLNEFVQKEFSAQTQQRRELWKQPIARRVNTGLAIGGLTIVDFGRDSATLQLSEINRSSFTVGAKLRLSRDDPDGDYVDCSLEKESDDTLVISPGPLQSFRKLKKGPGWTLDEDVHDRRQPLLAALDAIDAGNTPVARQVAAILDGAKADFDLARDHQLQARVARLRLDPKQREAVIRGITTGNYWVVQGAPTTGKTYTLAQLAITLAREGRRVLITGPDDFTVNHALHVIHNLSGHNPLCKIGNPNRTEGFGDAAGQVRIYENFTASALHPTDRGLIIGVLPETPGLDDSLAAVEFDTVLVDHAEQVGLPEAVCALLVGKRYLFFGDPAGKPPTIYGGKYRSPVVQQSVLEFANNLSPGTVLNTSFHMNDQLIDFPNKNFYQRRLRAAPQIAGRQLELQVQPPWPKFQEVLDPARSSVFVETAHKGCDMVSEDEARVAAWIAVVLTLGCRFPPEKIGIITPYRAQARMIQAGAVELAASRKERLPAGILFGTPEDMRHEGRDVVVYSLVNSDLKPALARGDDYFLPERLSMALTRAAVKRIVIASPYLLAVKPPLALTRWLSLVRQLAEESHKVALKIKLPGQSEEA